MQSAHPFRLIAPMVLILGAAAAMTTTANEGPVSSVQEGECIVFLGDSITQAGVQPKGYVTIVKQQLAEDYPALGIEVIGAGISGNRVPDLEKRLDDDVISKKPTVVVIYIGINDVWHSLNGRGTPIDRFTSGLQSVVVRIQAAGARVVLCTPSVIGEKTDGSNQLDGMLTEYATVIRHVAKNTSSQLLDLREGFLEHLKNENTEQKSQGIMTSDGVHLNDMGNQFVASQMLAALTGKSERILRHVVLFKFKDDTSLGDVEKVEDSFAKLPTQIDAIIDFEFGTNNSPEGLNDGFTHCFFVSFASEQGRAAYLPHAAHQAFVSLLKPHLSKVLVIDYWTR